MEERIYTTAGKLDFFQFENSSRGDDDKLAERRLETLLAANAESAFEKSLYSSTREKLEAALMKNPIETRKVFAYFGLILGTFTPAAMFTRFFIDARIYRTEDFWILGLMLAVNLIAAAVGYASGKLIGRIVFDLEKHSWSEMLLTLPFVGVLWGLITGGAAGLIVLIFGAFFGAFLGASVGAFAFPVFTVFHRLLKRGDKMDGRHFLPLALGVAFVISAFFLGI